jgi:hypothetical protein
MSLTHQFFPPKFTHTHPGKHGWKILPTVGHGSKVLWIFAMFVHRRVPGYPVTPVTPPMSRPAEAQKPPRHSTDTDVSSAESTRAARQTRSAHETQMMSSLAM